MRDPIRPPCIRGKPNKNKRGRLKAYRESDTFIVL